MGSINKKFNKYKNIDIKLSMRFKCTSCNYTKVIPREIFENINQEDFTKNTIFNCPNCNIRMNPIEVLADF